MLDDQDMRRGSGGLSHPLNRILGVGRIEDHDIPLPRREHIPEITNPKVKGGP